MQRAGSGFCLYGPQSGAYGVRPEVIKWIQKYIVSTGAMRHYNSGKLYIF